MDGMIYCLWICLLYYGLIFAGFVIRTAQACNFGESCPFPCRCQSGSCDSVTGECDSRGCATGLPPGYDWGGFGCQTGNLAYGKFATQNGVFGGRGASEAVDGLLSITEPRRCSHPNAYRWSSAECATNDDCSKAWWQVDLGGLHRVTEVTIANTNSAAEYFRLNHINIRVSNDSSVISGAVCSRIEGTVDKAEIRTFTCNPPLVGRYVTLFKNGSSEAKVFTVCEVIIYGNKFEECRDCGSPSMCTEDYGCVASCGGNGDQNTLCQSDCSRGSLSNCTCVKCRRNKCGGNGTCSEGCQQWWSGDKCETELVPLNLNNGLVVTSQASDSLTVSWRTESVIPQSLFGNYGYLIEYSRSSGTSWSRVRNVSHVNGQTYREQISGLVYNREYTVNVTSYRTQNNRIEHGDSISVSRKTDCREPNSPTINLARITPQSGVGLERIRVMWTDLTIIQSGCSSIERCTIYYRLSGGTEMNVNCELTSTSYILGVPTVGYYEVYIRVENNEGLGTNTRTQTVQIRMIPPEFPNNDKPSITDFNAYSITIAWNAISYLPGNYLYKYRLDYRGPSGSWIPESTESHTTGQSYRITIDALTYNTWYKVRVTPYMVYQRNDIYGREVILEQKSRCIAPLRPTIVSLSSAPPFSSQGLERISLSWRLPSNYGCSRLTTCAIYYIVSGGTWENTPCGSSTSKIFSVTNDGEYQVYIRIKNNEDFQSETDRQTVDIENIIPANFPRSDKPTITHFEANQMTVSWSAINTVPQDECQKCGYRLDHKRGTQYRTPWIAVSNEPHIPNLRYNRTIDGLMYNTVYTVRVTPYRIYRGNNIYGTAVSLEQKTSCIAPDEPNITTLEVIDPVLVPGLERIDISWTISGTSGCSRLDQCTLHYGAESLAVNCSSSSRTLTPQTEGEYDIYLEIVNNEDISSRSDSNTKQIRNIPKAAFLNSDRITVTLLTTEQIQFSWPAISTIPDDQTEGYGYRVTYIEGDTEPQELNAWTTLRNESHANGRTYEGTINGLAYNTNYTIRVIAYRRDKDGNIEDGSFLQVIQKTKCLDPEQPEITNVTVLPPVNSTGLERLYIAWVVPGGRGCNSLASCTIHLSITGGESVEEPCSSDPGQHDTILTVTDAGEVSVFVEIANNEQLSSRTTAEAVVVERIATEPTGDPLLAVYIVVPLLIAVVIVAVVIVRVRRGRPFKRPDIHIPKPRHPWRRNPVDNTNNTQDVPTPKPPTLPKNTRKQPNVSTEPASKPSVISNVVNRADLEAYFNDLVKRGKLKTAYEAIPKDGSGSTDIGRKADNIKKNRYKNIVPYDDTRVKLPLVDEQDHTDYINANYVTGYPNTNTTYIAAQGPKPETTDDFWRMIVDNNIRHIVMLTLSKETEKVLCEQYWPAENEPDTKWYGDIRVCVTDVLPTSHYTISTLVVSTQNIKLTVKHYQITTWRDKTKPDSPLPMYDLLHRVRSANRGRDKSVLLVHCSAGVGRTGTYIVLDYLLDQMNAEGQVDIDGTIQNLRDDRSHLVQTLTQYSFVYEFMVMYAQVGHSYVTRKELRDTLFISDNDIDSKYKMLLKLKNTSSSIDAQGSLPENRSKNRNPRIVPSDNARPFLHLPCPGSNDYINAVMVDSVWHVQSLILTQVPLPGTVVDFWRLVHDHGVSTVVLLDQLKPADKYWPQETGSSYEHGPLTVVLQNKYTSPNISHYDLRVFRKTRPDDGQDLRLYHLHGWYSAKPVPPSVKTAVDLLDKVKHPLKVGTKVIIQCLDGVAHSGLFSVASHLVAQSQIWEELDIPLAVMTVREKRPEFLINKAQIQFLYEFVHEKLDRGNSPYANMTCEPVYENTPNNRLSQAVYANTQSETAI